MWQFSNRWIRMDQASSSNCTDGSCHATVFAHISMLQKEGKEFIGCWGFISCNLWEVRQNVYCILSLSHSFSFSLQYSFSENKTEITTKSFHYLPITFHLYTRTYIQGSCGKPTICCSHVPKNSQIWTKIFFFLLV